MTLGPGGVWPHKAAWEAVAGRAAAEQETNSALETPQSSALPTPCLWLSGPDLELPTSRTLREYISVVLCHRICGSL